MDVPVFAQATVDQTDEFSRKLSVYARGQVGRLDYRLVLTDPFPVNTNGTVNGLPLPFAPNSPNATLHRLATRSNTRGFSCGISLTKSPTLRPT